MPKDHRYNIVIQWTGNTGAGTSSYTAYGRSHSIIKYDKPSILGSSDPAFRGDPQKHNPEELLLASIAACHMLWYLHLCSEAHVIVLDYNDQAIATMTESANGSGKFTEVTLHPVVKVAESSMISRANNLHKKANALCFIANSLNFKVSHVPFTTS
jgi:organic hydroperoxide reductase OsmC/OhrA